MENIQYLNKSVLLKEESRDFVSETLEEETLQLQEDIRKRKLTLIGLSTVYIVLILASLTFLT